MSEEESALLTHGIAANVRREFAGGVGGVETRRGTKHFAAGAKVWVMPPRWGDGGDQVGVVGRHRGTRGPYMLLVMPRRQLENFRVQGVYSPTLVAVMTRPMRHGGARGMSFSLWPDRETAESVAMSWNAA